MARLGRGRRSGTKLSRNHLVPPVSPLVRKRVVVEMDGANSSWRWIARIKRGRRPKAITVRARSVPTATPLVRKRGIGSQNPLRAVRRIRATWRTGVISRPPRPAPLLVVITRRVVQTSVSSSRARFVRTFFARHGLVLARPPAASPRFARVLVESSRRVRWLKRRKIFVSRAILPPALIVLRPKVAVVQRTRSSRVRMFFQKRGLIGARGVSTTTPTPLVRRQVFVNRALRSRLVRKKRINLLRPVVQFVQIFQRPRTPVLRMRSSRLRVFTAKRTPSLSRAMMPAPAQRQSLTMSARRRARFINRRRRSLILHPPAPQVARHPAIVSHRARRTVLRHRARILRPTFVPAPQFRHVPVITHRKIVRRVLLRRRTIIRRPAYLFAAPKTIRQRLVYRHRIRFIRTYMRHRPKLAAPSWKVHPSAFPPGTAGRTLMGWEGSIEERASSGAIKRGSGGIAR